MWTDIVDENMSFIIPDSLLIHLESWISSAGGREVSGVGVMEPDPKAQTFRLKKCWLMAAGSVAYTEIPGERMAKLIQEGVRPDQLKVWWHRHPVGNGIPGAHNWSGRDDQTIREEPFGIDPSMVGWLLSIVRTPRGWVARYDNHERKETTHMKVTSKVSLKQHEAAAAVIEHQIRAEVQASLAKQRPKQRVALPRKRGYKYPPAKSSSTWADSPRRVDPDNLEKILGGEFQDKIDQVGWDPETYAEVAKKLEYEHPEFVAFDFGVTIAEMKTVGLLDDERTAEVLRRIQERVDAGDREYIALIGQWDLVDL